MAIHPEAFKPTEATVTESKSDWTTKVVQGHIEEAQNQGKVGAIPRLAPTTDLSAIPDIYPRADLAATPTATNNQAYNPWKDPANTRPIWGRNTSLPSNWASMNEDERRAFEVQRIEDAEKAGDDSLFDKRGNARIGWHQDANGYWFDFEYA